MEKINIKLSVVAAKELEKAIARELEDKEEGSLDEILTRLEASSQDEEEDTSSATQ